MAPLGILLLQLFEVVLILTNVRIIFSMYNCNLKQQKYNNLTLEISIEATGGHLGKYACWLLSRKLNEKTDTVLSFV